MPERDRRRVMRVDVPRDFRGGDFEPHFVHLLNVSPLGVCIARLEPWKEGAACAVDLPPALGVLRLPGRVVWTRRRAADGIREGDWRSRYESGIEFTNLTASKTRPWLPPWQRSRRPRSDQATLERYHP